MPLTRRLDSRDVLDADATTSRAFPARVLGVYRRVGPNAWDDYLLVEVDGGRIEVLPGTPVQVEDEGPVVRLRRKGEVTVVSWLPRPGDVDERSDPRTVFLERFIDHEDPTPEGSLGAWLHGELSAKPEAKD
jgi:hypothetical protein